jgi:hypothetical protein
MPKVSIVGLFIDDIDRCLPENAITVLESLTLFFNNQHCIFVLAMDDDVVRRGIELRYKDVALNSRDYLDQIIQLPVFLPPAPFAKIRHGPVQLYSCFISYSHQDESFARRLHDALQSGGVRCWYAPEDIQGGKKIHEQIDAAIRISDKLLLVLSEHSMNSEWVKTEIADARRREVTENKRLLFPIRLVEYEKIKNWTYFDADTGKDSAREIREYFIPDFSNWKDYDSFEQAFSRLLRDLKADETQTST